MKYLSLFCMLAFLFGSCHHDETEVDQINQSKLTLTEFVSSNDHYYNSLEGSLVVGSVIREKLAELSGQDREKVMNKIAFSRLHEDREAFREAVVMAGFESYQEYAELVEKSIVQPTRLFLLDLVDAGYGSVMDDQFSEATQLSNSAYFQGQSLNARTASDPCDCEREYRECAELALYYFQRDWWSCCERITGCIDYYVDVCQDMAIYNYDLDMWGCDRDYDRCQDSCDMARTSDVTSK